MTARRRPTANTAAPRHITRWDSEPAPGRLSGLFIHNHPFKCDAQRRPGGCPRSAAVATVFDSPTADTVTARDGTTSMRIDSGPDLRLFPTIDARCTYHSSRAAPGAGRPRGRTGMQGHGMGPWRMRRRSADGCFRCCMSICICVHVHVVVRNHRFIVTHHVYTQRPITSTNHRTV